ncbi:MAG: hypothetical protein WCL71_10930 [Deltaproteobacteria bacterium]
MILGGTPPPNLVKGKAVPLIFSGKLPVGGVLSRAGERGAGGARIGGDQRETGRENGQGAGFRIIRRGAFCPSVRALARLLQFGGSQKVRILY